MSGKKKIGSAGRYGSRYGKKVRQLVSDIEKVQKRRHICPKCDMPYVNRVAAGIWSCKKCGAKFAGGAWSASTNPK
jgi:large subunit ribosomal protein L37Ae